MKINPSIFKAYDIRGIYPDELNKETAYFIGRAFVKFLRKKSPKVVVGRDNRLSSPDLFRALTKGIIDQGAKVVDIGLSTTPMLYFTVAYFKFEGGIEISASHNPSQYNGFKLVREKAIPISEKSGIKEIQKLVLAGNFKKQKKGKILGKKVLKEYVRFILKDFNLESFQPLKIVIDTANAVSGILIPEIFKKTKQKIYHLYSKLDGSFPNHNPDPLIKENLKTICQVVKTKKADLGVAFDGDGDRIFFIDEKGEVVSGDLITAKISELILKKNPKEKILYDIRSSNIVRETIEKAGGRPVEGRIGHSFIKEKMRKENIIFAGELSGHYYLREHYFCETPLFVLLRIIEEISREKKTLSEIISPFRKYFHSGEINFKVKNKEKVLGEIEKKFKTGKISKLDGIRIDFGDWWFLVRSSHTEPVLRLVIEAKTKKLLKEKAHFLSNFLKG
jgi:phosphomannomutase